MRLLRTRPSTALWPSALGAVFVYASLDKIAQPVDFARIVYHYRLVGPSGPVGPVPANLSPSSCPGWRSSSALAA